MDSPLPKDIIIAILSGSVSLAALLLVFVGLLLAQAASFGSDTSDDVIGKYAMAGKIGSIPVVLCLILGILSIYWLRYPNDCLFAACFWGFILLLVVSISYAILAIFYYLSPK